MEIEKPYSINPNIFLYDFDSGLACGDGLCPAEALRRRGPTPKVERWILSSGKRNEWVILKQFEMNTNCLNIN